MSLNGNGKFHFSSPDGTQSLTLYPNQPRITNEVMAAQFAAAIAHGKVSGKVEGTTITLNYVANQSVDSVLDDGEEEELYEPAPEMQEVVEAANAVEVPREVVISEAVAEIMKNGDKRQMTETGTPRISSVRKKSFDDVTPDEVDAAFEAYTANASE